MKEWSCQKSDSTTHIKFATGMNLYISAVIPVLV